MSVKIMGLVWDLRLSGGQKLVLLAYADHASHDGANIFPSVGLIAKKTGYGERWVQSVTRQLKAEGWLVADGSGPHGTNRWRFPLERVQNLQAAEPEAVQPVARQGEAEFTLGAQPASPRGAAQFTRGVNPTAPEPSLEPSVNQEEDETPDVAKSFGYLNALYEQNIGPITAPMANTLRSAAAEFPEAWFPPAFELAVRNNAPRWAYVQTVLDGWKRNGFGWKPGRPAPARDHPRREPRAFAAVRAFASTHGVTLDGG